MQKFTVCMYTVWLWMACMHGFLLIVLISCAFSAIPGHNGNYSIGDLYTHAKVQCEIGKEQTGLISGRVRVELS